MKSLIYWFSGGGSSYHVARVLQEGLEDTELVPVAAALEGRLETAERVGLVFPVYAWGPPVVVSKLIEKLPTEQPDYLFAVATYGGAPGSTMSYTRKFLEEKGLELDAAFSVKMVEVYPPMGGPPAEGKQKKINEAAEVEIAGILSRVRDSARGDFSKKNLLFSLIGRMVYPSFVRALAKQSGDKFSVDEKCTSCGICAKVCPVGNIEMTGDGRPEWSTHCEQCYACFHWCPAGAIQSSRKTPNTRRYHHPETTLKDMLFRSDE